MNLREELLISRPLEPGQELSLSILLTREYLSRLLDERLFKPGGISDQQYNLLRILKGGPEGGYLIREIRQRMIARNADVPRLVDRLAAAGLVQRATDAQDRRGCRVRITPRGLALEGELTAAQVALDRKIEGMLGRSDRERLVALLEHLRDGLRSALEADPPA